MTKPSNISNIHPDRNGAELRKAGWASVVYAAYAYADKQPGDIISYHRTMDAAQRKVGGSTFWAVKDL